MAYKNLRTEFTAQEFEELRKLVCELEAAPADKQKGIRAKLRRRGLYWSDLAKGVPYIVANLEKLLSKGVLRIYEAPNEVQMVTECKEMAKSGGRANSDEHYVIDLCDEILGLRASRQHRFDFLKGDSGRKLPVDAYYEELNLVIEYHERQHTEAVAFFDKKETVSGVSRGEQRKIYDERRKEMLPKYGKRLLIISYSDFGKKKQLERNRGKDLQVVGRLLKDFM